MPEIKPGSAFARDYSPQLDMTEQARSVSASKRISTSREKRLQSDDPIERMHARGTLPGLNTDPMGWEKAKMSRKASGL